jgi:hypothetical protein
MAKTNPAPQNPELAYPEGIIPEGFVPCLVHDAFVPYCRHKGCKYLHKHPLNYFERRSEKIKRRLDFTYIEMHTSHTGTKWIMPLNPYREDTPERGKFELFRQGWGEIQLVGRVPEDRFKFHRDEISYKYIAALKDHWIIPEDASVIDLMDYEEVDEVAYYNGPLP